jgi:hypothetical protein
MTPAKFERKIDALRERYDDGSLDEEEVLERMFAAMRDCLEQNGFGAGVDIINDMGFYVDGDE